MRDEPGTRNAHIYSRDELSHYPSWPYPASRFLSWLVPQPWCRGAALEAAALPLLALLRASPAKLLMLTHAWAPNLDRLERAAGGCGSFGLFCSRLAPSQPGPFSTSLHELQNCRGELQSAERRGTHNGPNGQMGRHSAPTQVISLSPARIGAARRWLMMALALSSGRMRPLSRHDMTWLACLIACPSARPAALGVLALWG